MGSWVCHGVENIGKGTWSDLVFEDGQMICEIIGKTNLDGGFKYCLFSPLFGEDFQFD